MIWKTVIKFMWDKPLYFRNRKWYTTENNSFQREKKKMTIQLMKKGIGTDGEYEEYKKNLRRHRLGILVRWAGVFAVMLIGVFAVRYYVEHKTYTDYEVTGSSDRSDTMNTNYAEFQGNVLKYGQDGISYVDSQNRLLWSQTYNMQHPVIDICGKSTAVAEENGTTTMIFHEDGYAGTIHTTLPIRKISVSSQGVLAVLLEDGDITRLYLYDENGEQLVEAKFELQDTGYPLSMSLSTDASKLAVSFLQVQDGGVNSCLAFYNFGSVGENESDHLVASRIVKGAIIPSIHYMDSSRCYAVGTNGILLYEGTQIPEETEEIPVEKEIRSVFYSEDYLGLVLDGEETDYELQVYDRKGSQEFSMGFDQEYTTLKFSGKSILIYNDFDCTMVNHSGKIFYEGSFEESVSNLYALSGKTRYVVMHGSRTDQIQLK